MAYTNGELCDMYRDLLDEIYPEVKFGDLTYSASYVLESVDPIAFQLGVNDYENMLSEQACESDDVVGYCEHCGSDHESTEEEA